MDERWAAWAAFVIILAGAWSDWRTREVSGKFLLISAGVGVCFTILGGRSWRELALSCLPGITLLVLSRLTNGGIGEGDGWFFVVMGLLLDAGEAVGLLLSGFCLCVFTGLLLLMQAVWNGRGCRNLRIPFLPFLIPGGLYLALCLR